MNATGISKQAMHEDLYPNSFAAFEDSWTRSPNRASMNTPRHTFGLTSSHHSMDGAMDDMRDAIRAIQSSIEKLQRSSCRHDEGIQQLQACQHHHCDSLADVYDDLGTFAERKSLLSQTLAKKLIELGKSTSSSNSKANHSSQEVTPNIVKERDLEAHVTRIIEDRVQQAVRDALHKQRLDEEKKMKDTSHSESQAVAALNKRIDDLTETLEAVESTATSCESAVKRLREDIETVKSENLTETKALRAKIDKHKAKSVTTPQLNDYKVEQEKAREKAKEDAAKREDELRRRLEKRYNKGERAVYREVEQMCANNHERCVDTANERIAVLLEGEKESSSRDKNKLETLRRCVDTLDSAVGKAADDIAKLVAYNRAKDSADTTAKQREVTELAETVREMRGMLQRHEQMLEALRCEGSLEGVYEEVKDWLLDLERKAATKGEMIEAVSLFTEELAQLKHDLFNGNGDTACSPYNLSDPLKSL